MRCQWIISDKNHEYDTNDANFYANDANMLIHKKRLPTFVNEIPLWKKGYYVIGVDEVGRGALAGPLTVGAVCFYSIFSDSVKAFPPTSARLAVNIARPACRTGRSARWWETLPALPPEKVQELGINDSKKLSPAKREKLAKIIKKICLAYTTASVSNRIINRLGIAKATQLAMRKVIYKLRGKSFELKGKKLFILIDAFYIKYLRSVGLKNQKAIIKGDEKSISIAAASIIAKVERDHNMIKLHHKYPIYFWKKNKGYGTKKHIEAIKKFGKSKLHRDLFLRKIL